MPQGFDHVDVFSTFLKAHLMGLEMPTSRMFAVLRAVVVYLIHRGCFFPRCASLAMVLLLVKLKYSIIRKNKEIRKLILGYVQ